MISFDFPENPPQQINIVHQKGVAIAYGTIDGKEIRGAFDFNTTICSHFLVIINGTIVMRFLRFMPFRCTASYGGSELLACVGCGDEGTASPLINQS
jgi:hypothetical protein